MEEYDSNLTEHVAGPNAAEVGHDLDRVEAFEIKEIFATFTPEKWAELSRRLLYFFSGKYDLDPSLEWEDLVQEAVLLILQDKRHWYPRKTTFFKCLCGVIWSHAGHTLAKTKRLPLRSIDDMDALRMNDDALSPLMREEMRELVRDDPDLPGIVELYFKDPSMKPRHLHKELPGLSKSDVVNALKRLKRLIHKRKEEQGNG